MIRNSINERLAVIIKKIIPLFYFLTAVVLNVSCVYHEIRGPIKCSSQRIEIVIAAQGDEFNCQDKNGFVEVDAFGSDYFTYALDSGAFGDQKRFENLGAGRYTVFARSFEGCLDSLEVDVKTFNSTLGLSVRDLVANSECTDYNGSAIIEVDGGTPPFFVHLDQQLITNHGAIGALSDGLHHVAVHDANGCVYQTEFTIPRLNTDVSWATDIKPIIERSCAKPGCHGINSPRIKLTTYQEVKENALNVKARTRNGSMPYDGPLPQEEVRLIGCWVDDGALNN